MKLFILIVLVLNIFLKKFKKLLKNCLEIKIQIFRLQEDNSIMCCYFCIGFIDFMLARFIDFMLAGKKLTDYTNLFSPYDLKKRII